jgi:hypothetical protein
MFGIRIITNRALADLKKDLQIQMLEVFKESFKEFTSDVVECIQNNLQGFSQSLDKRPCLAHNDHIEKLVKKYCDHDRRIKKLENDVKNLQK